MKRQKVLIIDLSFKLVEINIEKDTGNTVLVCKNKKIILFKISSEM